MNNNQIYLDILAFIDQVMTKIGTLAYLWGGWVPDVWSNKLLRGHDDADYLILNLYNYRDKVQQLFINLNWQVKIVANGDLVINKGNLKIHFGHVEIKGRKALWYHNGQKGQIVFPANWLHIKPVTFLGQTIHVVKPQFQFCLKTHPELMNPNWLKRQKDNDDLEILKQLILKTGITLASIEGKMIST